MARFSILLLLLLCSSLTGEEYRTKVTYFCSCQTCCSWYYDEKGIARFNSNGKEKIVGQTASTAIAREGLTLALPKEFPFGTHVYTSEGNLLGVVEDRGGSISMDGNTLRIDVYMESHEEALKEGVKWMTVYTEPP